MSAPATMPASPTAPAANIAPAPLPSHDRFHQHNPWYFFTSANNLMYATRATLAGLAALLAAMWLQLEAPRWAILTTIIVSPPVRGNALRKAGARIIGTFIGCTAGIVLVALAPQDRVGFTILFAAWLAGCAYWASLKRGFVAYGAVLAAFTCALIAADVSTNPQGTFDVAMDRTSATIVGIIFALLASEIGARSDDAPGDLVNRFSAVACDLLFWAATRLDPRTFDEPEDAPCTTAILAIDELNANAMAERPALRWVKQWIRGVPTALLCLQSDTLCTARHLRTASSPPPPELEQTRAALLRVRNVIMAGAKTPISSLRQEADSLVQLRADIDHAAARQPSDLFPCLAEIVSALLYLLASVQATLLIKAPEIAVRHYPAPKFLAIHHRATVNMARAAIGVAAAFLIWDASAWSEGPFFIVNVAVAFVIYLTFDNPLGINNANIIGAIAGGVVGVALKHWVLPFSDDPIWLCLVFFPPMFVGVLTQTQPNLISPGITYIFIALTTLEPTNPQQYDLTSALNIVVAVVAAYTFVPVIFLLVGTPKKGRERINQLLGRMRRHLRMAHRKPFRNREERLKWETSMYDALQQLQLEAHDPHDRAAGVDLLLHGRQIHAPVHVPAASSVIT